MCSDFILPFLNGQNINYLFQKYITKTYTVTYSKFLFKTHVAFKCHDYFERLKKIEEPFKNYYEFVQGWEALTMPLAICQLGHETNVVDIRALIVYELVNDANNLFKRLNVELPIKNPSKTEDVKNFGDLEEHFAMKYHAPKEARNTDFTDNYFNFSSSTSTMEHGPSDDFLKILDEAYGIMQKGGQFSMGIDYMDHVSYFNSNLFYYIFLQYYPSKWKKFNSELNFQNRLRHSDCLKIIAQMPFEVLINMPRAPNEGQRIALKNMKLDELDKGYSYNTPEITESEIVLR